MIIIVNGGFLATAPIKQDDAEFCAWVQYLCKQHAEKSAPPK